MAAVAQGVVVGSQPVTSASPVGPITNQLQPVISQPHDTYVSSGIWSDSPFACCTELGSFCMALWCPCIQLGLNTQKSGLGAFQKYCLLASLPEAVNYVLQIWMFFSHHVVSEDEGITGYWILRALQFVSSFLVLALLMNVRHKLRDMYSITEETDASSCCLVYCCSPCTLSQEARHIARVKGEMAWPLGQGPQQCQVPVIVGYPVMASTVVQAGQVPSRSPIPGQHAAPAPQSYGFVVTQPQVVVAQPLPNQRGGNVAQIWPEMPVAQSYIAPGPQTEPLPAGAVMGMPPQQLQSGQQRNQQQGQQPILAEMVANRSASDNDSSGFTGVQNGSSPMQPRNID